MGAATSWRLVKFLTVSAVLVLSAHVLFTVLWDTAPKLTPLAEREQRLMSPRSYRFLLNQPGLCADTSPFLLFMVPVAPWEAAARDAVRKTWGGAAAAVGQVTVFFMGVTSAVGGPPGPGLQDELEEESRTHGDMVQMSFQDTYQNLTLKTVMMMNWAMAHCPSASYVMKVDSDVFVNVFYLPRWLRSSPRQAFVTGSLITDGRPRRDSSSKWGLSKEQYPEDSFPPYVSGAGYVLSVDLASRIAWASGFVPPIPLEDVYVGLCLRLLGVRPAYALSVPTLRNLFEVRKLEYDRCQFAKLLVVNGFEPEKLQHIWRDFSKSQGVC